MPVWNKPEFEAIKLGMPPDSPGRERPSSPPARGGSSSSPPSSPARGASSPPPSPKQQGFGTPLDTPREVFPHEVEYRPKSRGEEASREPFRIPLTPEVFRRAKADKLRRQMRVYVALLVILVSFLLLGLAYFSPFQLYENQDNSDWHIRISQLGAVFSIFSIAVLINLSCLVRVYFRGRRNRLKWMNMETGEY